MANSYDDDFEHMFMENLSVPSPTTGGTRTLASTPAFSGDHNDDDNHQADSYSYWGTSSLERVVADSGDYYNFPTEMLQPRAPSTSMSLDQINAILEDGPSDLLTYLDHLSRMGNVGDSFLNMGQDPVSGLDLHPAVNSLSFSERHMGSAGANVPPSLASFYALTNCEMKNYSGGVPLSGEDQVVSMGPGSRSGHINFASQPGFGFTLADSNSYNSIIGPAVDLGFSNNDIPGPSYLGKGAEFMADLAFSDPDSPDTLLSASPPELVPDEHHQRNARLFPRTGKAVKRDRVFEGVKKAEKQKTASALFRQIIVFDSIQGRSSKNPRHPFDPAKRREVAAVRAKGACFKCKMKRKKCDLGVPCQNCMDDPERCPDPTIMVLQPCFRLNLSQCGFFRTESALWSRPLRRVMKWVSDSPVRLSIQFIPFYEPGPVLEINCCHFTPEDNDIVVRKWGPGDDQVMSIPTYCAPNLKVLQSQLPDSVTGYLNFILEWHSEDIPDMVAKALAISLNRVGEGKNTILHAALRIWAGSRLCAAPRTLCGEKTLGLDRIRAAGAHDNGFIPIPPMLDYQLDSMMIDWMKELMELMLKELWKVLLKKGTHRKESWFDVFLTIFLLVNNLEYVYEAQMDFINSHGGAGVGYSGQHIAISSQPMLNLWKWSAEHLIYVFRYYIRKCAFGDAPLFSDVCFTDAVAAANLDESAQAYINCIIEWVEGEGSGPQAREGNARDRDGKYQMVWCRKLLLNTEFPVSLM